MIGFLLPEILPCLGLLFGETLLAPIVASVAALAATLAACCCVCKCMRCQARDCLCLKRLFLWTGHDKFDDFELMVMVHEVMFEKAEEERSTMVRVTAGRQSAKTDANCKGIFQQPLHLLVEQGTKYVVVDLLDRFCRVLASLTLDVTDEIISIKNGSERLYNMKRRDKRLASPKIKLSMVANTEEDMEQGLLSDCLTKKSDVNFLLQQQFLKCGEGLSEAEVLKKSSAGPLELLESMGNSKGVWVAVLGPPSSSRWMLSIWNNKHDYDNKKSAIQEVDLLRIQSVQADSTLQHVFEISYYDESRLRQTLTFRCMDRARDVWVEILHLLVQRAYESRLMKKSQEFRASVKRDKKKSHSSGEKYSRDANKKVSRDKTKTEK
mmetsp:Transcript_85978/g.157580  ORF Transcript_85978/g.157580 Transcript_85978/m.157580 type:complete len:380 (-) Transcript_85978:105-1244(-)